MMASQATVLSVVESPSCRVEQGMVTPLKRIGLTILTTVRWTNFFVESHHRQNVDLWMKYIIYFEMLEMETASLGDCQGDCFQSLYQH